MKPDLDLLGRRVVSDRDRERCASGQGEQLYLIRPDSEAELAALRRARKEARKHKEAGGGVLF